MTVALSVVVIDDHSLFRAGVVQSLQADDAIEVIAEGGSGREAVELCALHRPDVALVDISMPDDAITAVAQISNNHPQMKVIMLTVSENEDDVLRSLEAGAVGYILKGVSGLELVSAVKRVARGDRIIAPGLSSRMLINLAQNGGRRLIDTLSNQETRTLELVARGLSNAECALRLGIGEQAIKYHMTHIMKKLKVRNRVEASLVARQAWTGSRLTNFDGAQTD